MGCIYPGLSCHVYTEADRQYGHCTARDNRLTRVSYTTTPGPLWGTSLKRIVSSYCEKEIVIFQLPPSCLLIPCWQPQRRGMTLIVGEPFIICGGTMFHGVSFTHTFFFCVCFSKAAEVSVPCDILIFSKTLLSAPPRRQLWQLKDVALIQA